jgi:hypothetical protein
MERKTLRLTLLAAGLALSGAAWAQASSTTSYIERTSPRFESFAGSRDNYSSLATGLRTGSAITLTGSGETVSFNSPTKPMGYGNITRSLDLAQRQLAAQGITNPTPSQLQAAMTGGTIKNADGTVTKYEGVLKLRADGMGWGQIARKVDVHPGMGKSTSAAASSSGRITTAAGGSVAARGKAAGKPATAGSQGRQNTQISSAAGGNAFGHGSGRGVGASGGMSNAGGAGHGHGNAGGNAGGGGRGK